ncbi:MAG: DUF5362 domain-containing protein [Candidatus Hydrothermae bacterium]|nr:DUF5362 domain-containing protein [Candidatus Hydrothermae bacterium]
MSSTGSMDHALRGLRPWLRFLGILNLIMGVLEALTVVGLVVAWVNLWLGYLLYQAAGRADEVLATGSQESLVGFLEKLRLFFMILGLLTVVLLLAGVAFFLLGLLTVGRWGQTLGIHPVLGGAS